LKSSAWHAYSNPITKLSFILSTHAREYYSRSVCLFVCLSFVCLTVDHNSWNRHKLEEDDGLSPFNVLLLVLFSGKKW